MMFSLLEMVLMKYFFIINIRYSPTIDRRATLAGTSVVTALLSAGAAVVRAALLGTQTEPGGAAVRALAWLLMAWNVQ